MFCPLTKDRQFNGDVFNFSLKCLLIAFELITLNSVTDNLDESMQ